MARKIELPKLESDFAVVGKLKGVKSDNFYKELKTKNGKAMRVLNFRVEYEDGKSLPITLLGLEKDNVYFYKKGEDGEKGNTQKISWNNRMSFNEDGYSIIGVTVGLNKNDNNKTDAHTLVEYDACSEIARELNNIGDGGIIRVIGEISHDTYQNKKGEDVAQTRFVLNKIYISSEESEEASEVDSKNHFFHQSLVINNVEPDKSCEDSKRFIIEGQVVNYNNIRNVTIYTDREKFAKGLKSLLKKNKDNIMTQLFGEIVVSKVEEEVVVDDDDDWYGVDVSKSTYSPTVIELYAIGANKETLDTETYSQDKVDEAIIALNKDKEVEKSFNGKDDEVILEATDTDDEDWEEGWN